MNKKNSFGAVAGKIWSQYSFIFVFLIILVGYAFTIQANGNAFKWSHIAAVLGSQNTCIVGTMALGMALVIITGQIDLSIGSSLVLCTGVTIMVFNVTNSILLMVLAALVSGALCGALNGVLAGCAKMPPFVVTLGYHADLPLSHPVGGAFHRPGYQRLLLQPVRHAQRQQQL